MISSVREILKITTVDSMKAAFDTYESELDQALTPLIEKLNQNVLSTDVTSIQTHMGFVESWRERLVKHLSLTTGFVEHAKSSVFLPAKDKSITELDREAARRTLTGGFAALQVRLDGLISCVDSRVNLCKKLMGIEETSIRRNV